MCGDGKRGFHRRSDCGRPVLLSSLQRDVHVERQVSEQQAQCRVSRLRWDQTVYQTSNGA